MAPLMRMLISNSEGDRPLVPNHYCTGKGCIVCLTRGRTVAASLLQQYSSTPQRWTCSVSHAEPAIPPFDGGYHELPNSSIVDVMLRLNDSEPEPPHKCRVLPCRICGRTW